MAKNNRIRNAIARGSILLVSLLVTPGLASAAKHFIQDSDYKDGSEVVGKFLKDDDYALMVSDIERNGQEFDWGWVKAEGKEKKPGQLQFDISSYGTIYVPLPLNFGGMAPPEMLQKVHEAFVTAAQTLGLKVVDNPESAGLELGVAVVGAKRERTYVYVAMIDPFIKLEVRLTDRKSGQRLMVLRNRAHSGTPEDAAFRYADEMVGFLR